jgi:kynurenine 3-monooxygenase
MHPVKNIAICGAGLVGSLLSIYLSRRGYQVNVFERRSDMRKSGFEGGRSINLALSNRGIRALEEVGLAEEMKAVAIPMHGRMMHDAESNLTFQPYGTKGQFINSVSRSALNVVLMNKAESLGVNFHFNHRVTHVNLANTSLEFENQEEKEKFDLIIGADGAFSAVRGAMQITDRFDYSQDYIDHGYKELHIPPGKGNSFQLEKNALHIWPRESFMMIALPNPDASFTVTLFFPLEGVNSFETLNSNEEIEKFFRTTFPDAVPLMPSLLEDFHSKPTSSLAIIKCYPWVKNNTLLIGDAAHAIVPFFGQGMNAGFEDCRILNQLLNQHNDNWKIVLDEFQKSRKKDADAIAQLTLDNFIEMRDLVADADFLLRKKIESKLHELFPEKWVPLYSMVTFHDETPYSIAYETGLKQKEIMDIVMSSKDIEKNWEHLNFEEIVNQLNN